MDSRWGNIRAIPTRYAGHFFRSRLEARWAVFLDYAGLRWEYEPEGFELGDGVRYLPDFWVPALGCWVEVKPEEPTVEEWRQIARKAGRLAKQSETRVVVLTGLTSPEYTHPTPHFSFFDDIEVFGEYAWAGYYQWAACLECGEIDIAADPPDRAEPMRCGHYALGTTEQLRSAWSAALSARF